MSEDCLRKKLLSSFPESAYFNHLVCTTNRPKPQIYSVYHHKQTKTNTNWEATVAVTSTWCHKYSVEQQYKYFYLAWLLEQGGGSLLTVTKSRIHLCVPAAWSPELRYVTDFTVGSYVATWGEEEKLSTTRWEGENRCWRKLPERLNMWWRWWRSIWRGLVASWPRGQRGPHLQLVDGFFWVLFKASLLDVEVGRSE